MLKGIYSRDRVRKGIDSPKTTPFLIEIIKYILIPHR